MKLRFPSYYKPSSGDYCSRAFSQPSSAFWLDDWSRRREQGANKEVKFVLDRKIDMCLL